MTAIGEASPPDEEVARKRRPYRRTQIQQAAIVLFYEKGYAETSIEDIGAAVGLAGPSIYRHFASKAEILETALSEKGSVFWEGLERVRAAESNPHVRLLRAIDVYVEALYEDPRLTAVSIQVRPRLTEAQRRHADREDRRLVNAWLDLLLAARPELERAEARLLVRGALDVSLAMAVARTSLSETRAKNATARATGAVLLA